MLKTLVVVAFALAVAGCGSSKKIYRPDGSEGYLIDCSGTSLVSCQEKAGAICRDRGYIVLGQETQKQAQSSSGLPETANPQNVKQTMFIRCK